MKLRNLHWLLMAVIGISPVAALEPTLTPVDVISRGRAG